MSIFAFDVLPHVRQIFTVAIVALLPFVDLRQMRRLQRYTSSIGRLSVYRLLLPWLWATAMIAVALALPGNLLQIVRAPSDMSWLFGIRSIQIGLYALLAVCLFLFLAQTMYLGSTCARRKKYAKAVSDFRYLLPVTPSERYWWMAVCLTAGICEEIIFRGYVLQFFSGRMGGGASFGLTIAWLVSSAAFGMGHIYQGLGGMVRTAAAGLVFGLLALLAGSLILPILVHVLFDAAPLWVYRPEQDDPDEAKRLVQGYDLTASIEG